MHKIRYLCSVISGVEWSGVLFYKLNGSIMNPKSAVITLEDVFLCDIGTKGYTEYDFDSDITDYMMDNPSVMSMYKGHIHSHNTFDTFFSGTDIDELKDNSENYNFYLSIIVNNAMQPTARISFVGKPETITITANNEKGKPYKIKSGLTKQKLFIYDTDIVTEDPIKVSDTFIKRIAKVEEKKKIKEAEKQRLATIERNKLNAQNFITQGSNSKPFWNDDLIRKFPIHNWNDSFRKEMLPDENKVDVLDLLVDQKYEDFGTYLLRLGNVVTNSNGTDDLEDALEDIATSKTEDMVINTVLGEFMTLHGKFFNGNEANAESGEFILTTIGNVIRVYEEHEENYVWLTKIILSLKSFGTKLAHELQKAE